MPMKNDKLITLKALAAELGVGYSFTRAMKKAGMPTPGGRVCAPDARQWLRKNPDFRPTAYIEPNGRRRRTPEAGTPDCGNPLCPTHHDGPAPYCQDVAEGQNTQPPSA